MNLAGTEYSTNTRSFDIFVSGCTRACPGCFNPEAQEFDFGEPLDLQQILRKIIDHSDIIDNIRIMGGDLLCQKESEAYRLTLALRCAGKSLHLYTGAEISEVPQWCLDIFDVIKTGTYQEELKQSEGLASSNQRLNVKGVDY